MNRLRAGGCNDYSTAVRPPVEIVPQRQSTTLVNWHEGAGGVHAVTDGYSLAVSEPAERPAVLAVAREAAETLLEALAALSAQEREWLKEFPLDRGLQAAAAFRPHHRYDLVPQVFGALATALVARGGPEWAGSYARLLLYAQLARLAEQAPVVRIPEMLWQSTEASLRTLLAELRDYSIEGGLRDEMFLKDLSVAQLRVLCPGFLVVEVRRLTPLRLMPNAPLGHKASVAAYLGLHAFRRGLYTCPHAWRGFREPRRAEPWQARVLRMYDAIEVNPQIRGDVQIGWLEDPQLVKISPRHAERATGLVAIGGRRFRVGEHPEATKNALAVSTTRQLAYAGGRYRPALYGIVTRRDHAIAWARAQRGQQSP
jgi:hypothetical protein